MGERESSSSVWDSAPDNVRRRERSDSLGWRVPCCMQYDFRIGLLLSAVFMDVLVYSFCVPFFPSILGSGVSEEYWLNIQALSNLSAALVGALVGWLSDKFGRVSILVASQFFGVGCGFMLAVGSWIVSKPTKREGLAVLLLSAGFVLRKANRTVPMVMALLTDVSATAKLRKQRTGFLGATFGIGFAIGPGVASLLSQHLERHDLFSLGVLISTANVVATLVGIAPMVKARERRDGGSDAGLEHAVQKESESISWRQILSRCSRPDALPVFIIHATACFAQFVYITSIGTASLQRFKMDTESYGYLVSFFGLSYSFALIFVVPALDKAFDSDKWLLVLGLGVTAASRFAASSLAPGQGAATLSPLFVIHAFTSAGTAIVNVVISNAISCAGKAQKVLHWDYQMYSGKGIGCVQIRGPEDVGPIDLFVSHFVAYYTPKPEEHGHDEYVHHRRLGAWEASQFIKRSAREESLVLCCVDLNADPETLTYQSIRGITGLQDAWKTAGRARNGVLPEALSESERLGLTCNFPGNCYHENNAWIASGEPSARVDYIMYRTPEDGRLSLEWCERRFSGVDDTDTAVVSLSDHSAVLASFTVHAEKQPACVETEEKHSFAAGQPVDEQEQPMQEIDLLSEPNGRHERLGKILASLEESAELGISCAHGRSRDAANKGKLAAFLSLCSLLVPHLMGWESTLPRVLLQFVICAGLAWVANACFVLGSITVPDEASAMMFMKNSVRLERLALEHHQGVLMDLSKPDKIASEPGVGNQGQMKKFV